MQYALDHGDIKMLVILQRIQLIDKRLAIIKYHFADKFSSEGLEFFWYCKGTLRDMVMILITIIRPINVDIIGYSSM